MMKKLPRSLLAFRMARLETLEYVVRRLLREHMLDSGITPDDVDEYAQRAKQHFAAHPPLNVPAPEMTAAVDLFFNTLSAELKTAASSLPRR